MLFCTFAGSNHRSFQKSPSSTEQLQETVRDPLFQFPVDFPLNQSISERDLVLLGPGTAACP